MKNKFFLLLLLGVSINAFAQIETDSTRAIQFKMNPKYRSISAGVGNVFMKNSYLSPLSYAGVSLGLSTATSSYHKWGVYDWSVDGYFDTAGEGLEMMGGQFKYNTYWHFNLLHTKEISLYAGAGASADFGVTMNSYSIGYNQTSINGDINILPSVLFKWRFKLFYRHFFDLSQQLSTPLLGFGIYPNYSSTTYGPLSDTGSSEFGGVFTSLHNCWGLSGRTYIDWRRRNKKTGAEYNSFFRLGYQYEGLRLNSDSNTFQISRGVFMIGLVQKF